MHGLTLLAWSLSAAANRWVCALQVQQQQPAPVVQASHCPPAQIVSHSYGPGLPGGPQHLQQRPINTITCSCASYPPGPQPHPQ